MRSQFLRAVFASLCLLQSIQQVQSAPVQTDSAVDRRILNFPKQYSIGTLYLIPSEIFPDIGAAKLVSAACGKVSVTVPKHQWLMLETNRKGYDNPVHLAAIGTSGPDVIQLTCLSLDESEGGNAEKFFLNINHVKGVKGLLIDHSDATDKAIEQMTVQPDLIILSANLCTINGDCFKGFNKFPNLKKLHLMYTQLAPENLKYLPLAGNLSTLNIRYAQITDDGLKSIAHCPHLTELFVTGNKQITDAGLKHLLDLKHLTNLDVSGTKVTSNGLKTLAPLKLTKLTVSKDMLAGKDLDSFRQAGTVVHFASKVRADSEVNDLLRPLH